MRDRDNETSTCAETLASLVIRSPDMISAEIGAQLQIDPTYIDACVVVEGSSRIHVWRITTEKRVDSLNEADHILWILSQLRGKQETLCHLRQKRCEIRMACYWASAMGHGGPTIAASLAKELGALDLDIWFDVYFFGD